MLVKLNTAFIFLALIKFGSASPLTFTYPIQHLLSSDEVYEANIDELIDENIESIQSALAPVDPGKLRDVELPIALGITQYLTDGWSQNLSQLERDGSCILRYSKKLLTIDANFVWYSVVTDYKYQIKAGLISRRGDVHTEMTELKANIVIDVDLDDRQIILQTLNFINAGEVNIKLEGHILDKLYNLIIKAVTKFAKTSVLKNIEDIARITIEKEIEDFNNDIKMNETSKFKFIDRTI
ncbi:hypothetical protein QAD02_006157 [Eretmocerus hayati]|uniref:Uncharacterized protein n=1 Tax=Eretmocerus hayati TaxID=131215 RepID=A0ACC2N094_9HYME|nr:hypothetical protein QAD02_006157 [Eretmocerus hayati]